MHDLEFEDDPLECTLIPLHSNQRPLDEQVGPAPPYAVFPVEPPPPLASLGPAVFINKAHKASPLEESTYT